MFPEMSQNGLEMVPIASGGAGNLFLLYNNAFLYHNQGPFFPIIYYPYSPVKFPIPLVDPSLFAPRMCVFPLFDPPMTHRWCLFGARLLPS